MQSTASAATRTAGKTNTFAGEGAGPATNAAAREAMREAVQLRSQMRQQRIRERVEEASTNEAAYQDPAELLAIHMCTPAELTPQACVARMVYFTIKSEDFGRVGSGSEVTYVSSTEGMTTGAASAASAMEAALDYGVLAGGSMVMLELGCCYPRRRDGPGQQHQQLVGGGQRDGQERRGAAALRAALRHGRLEQGAVRAPALHLHQRRRLLAQEGDGLLNGNLRCFSILDGISILCLLLLAQFCSL